MRTQTHMLNPDPKKCDAYHEAGHAVVGVIHGIRLDYVTAKDTHELDPHCCWNRDYITGMLATADEGTRIDFTNRFAEMCLAGQYAEVQVCNTSSDEQKEAYHYDYLDIEVMRRKANLGYFGLVRVGQLKNGAHALVTQYNDAIHLVAEQLLIREKLSHEEVQALVTQAIG